MYPFIDWKMVGRGRVGGGGGGTSALLSLPGQHGSTQALLTNPTNSKLKRQHQSTAAKVHGCLSTKRDFFQKASFAF